MAKKNILAVVTDLTLFRKLESILARGSLEVHRVPSGAGALVLAGNRVYDLIVIGAPMPDLGLQKFLTSLRSIDSPSSNSPVVVMATDRHVGALAGALETERVRVLANSAAEKEIQSAVTAVLGVAARTSSRILVEIAVTLGEGQRRRVFQTHNLSETGMLLRGSEGPLIGSPVQASFALRGDTEPIEVEGEVVRHTREDIEGVRGFAIHFTSMSAADRELLADFVRVDLERRAAEQPEDPDELDGAPAAGAS